MAPAIQVKSPKNSTRPTTSIQVTPFASSTSSSNPVAAAEVSSVSPKNRVRRTRTRQLKRMSLTDSMDSWTPLVHQGFGQHLAIESKVAAHIHHRLLRPRREDEGDAPVTALRYALHREGIDLAV